MYIIDNIKSLSTHEILNWIQEHKAVIHIKQGPEAIENIVGNGIDFVNTYAIQQGLEGYWVEIALHTDCAASTYCRSLNAAIAEAFNGMIQFAIEEGYLDKGTYSLTEKSNGLSWIGKKKYNFVLDEIQYNIDENI